MSAKVTAGIDASDTDVWGSVSEEEGGTADAACLDGKSLVATSWSWSL